MNFMNFESGKAPVNKKNFFWEIFPESKFMKFMESKKSIKYAKGR